MKDEDLVGGLIRLARFLEDLDRVEEHLDQLAAMAADAVGVKNCSLMLLKEQDSCELRLRVSGHCGSLPEAAYQEATRIGEGIAGHVAATSQPLLIEDIDYSPFAGQARFPAHPSKDFLSVPIRVSGRVAGVINVNTHKDRRPLGQADLDRLILVSLCIGKSIQAIQLQNLLSSRYAQFALAEEGRQTGAIKDLFNQEPGKLARILAKTFYREMTKAGFGSDHIISAAAEIIAQLSDSVEKHRKRLHLD